MARLGQNFLIENPPGAGGNIGTDALTKATPDGYSMAPVTVGGWTINQYLFARMPYDPDRDLQPISMHWTLSNVFIASTTHCPATTAAELITWGPARRQLAERGTTPAGGGPAPNAALIRAEVERWGRVVRERNIRVD
jgi:tripartite-type tricarboxylate transporter receptor subunit TctC